MPYTKINKDKYFGSILELKGFLTYWEDGDGIYRIDNVYQTIFRGEEEEALIVNRIKLFAGMGGESEEELDTEDESLKQYRLKIKDFKKLHYQKSKKQLTILSEWELEEVKK